MSAACIVSGTALQGQRQGQGQGQGQRDRDRDSASSYIQHCVKCSAAAERCLQYFIIQGNCGVLRCI